MWKSRSERERKNRFHRVPLEVAACHPSRSRSSMSNDGGIQEGSQKRRERNERAAKSGFSLEFVRLSIAVRRVATRAGLHFASRLVNERWMQNLPTSGRVLYHLSITLFLFYSSVVDA